MKLIVEIDEKDFDRCKAWVKSDTFLPETRAIANGTPITEGDLISKCDNCDLMFKEKTRGDK